MSKSLEELKNYKLRELSSGFDQNNNINVFSKWSYEEGWKDAIKAVSEREKKLVEALEKINREELNSQRPGGGYSNSAKISYEALKEFRGGK